MNRLDEIRQNPTTGRVGLKWTDDEDKELLSQLQQGMEYGQIATLHQRTENGVKTRVMEIHLKKVLNQEMTMEEASALLRVPNTAFEAFRHRYEKKQAFKEERQRNPRPPKTETAPKPTTAPVKGNTSAPYLPILIEIRDYLKVLVDKNLGKN
jgi:hypothetical protein